MAILVRRACLEWTAPMAQTATMVRRDRPAMLARMGKMARTATMARQDRPAILVQMGTMAQTATKVLRALKDSRATGATEAMQV